MLNIRVGIFLSELLQPERRVLHSLRVVVSSPSKNAERVCSDRPARERLKLTASLEK